VSRLLTSPRKRGEVKVDAPTSAKIALVVIKRAEETVESERDLTAYVHRTAEIVGIQLAAHDEAAVVAVFANLARRAAFLFAAPLPEEIESASIFTAFDVGER
jgi:hypothetical protein